MIPPPIVADIASPCFFLLLIPPLSHDHEYYKMIPQTLVFNLSNLPISVSSMVVAAASLSLSSPSSLLGLRSPPLPRRLRVRASAAAAAAAPSAAAVAGTLYDVLGIGAGATGREIKAAYRRLARERHPDVARGGASADEFIRIHAAYATLSDPDHRARYDRSMPLSAAAAATVAPRRPSSSSSSSSFSCAAPPSFARSGRRTWETDQCW